MIDTVEKDKMEEEYQELIREQKKDYRKTKSLKKELGKAATLEQG